MDFFHHNLSDEMMRALTKMEFTAPTPVQEQTIAPMLEKKDLLVQSPTGSGKTCAFGIPAVESVDGRNRAVQTVILSPTRELALQITAVLRSLSCYKQGVRMITLYGGEPIGRQIGALRRKPQIVVATPGRLLDHLRRHTIQLDKVGLVVLDEADRMLDMGFRGDIEAIFSQVTGKHQTVLFSATLSEEICRVAEDYQTDPQTIQIAQERRTVESVEQFYTEVPTGAKAIALDSFLGEHKDGQTLVFVNTKRMADQLAEELAGKSYRAEALHGGLRQSQRDHVMRRFRQGATRVLVATDVAARGIDVSGMSAVINYDIPANSDDYVHRIGRTGRANHSGTAYTILYGKERHQLQMIVRDTKAVIDLKTVEGLPASAVKGEKKRPAGAGKPNSGSGSRRRSDRNRPDNRRSDSRPDRKPGGRSAKKFRAKPAPKAGSHPHHAA